MRHRYSNILMLLILCLTSTSGAEDYYSVQKDPVTKKRYFLFKSQKGYVRFYHEQHLTRMKPESCLPCHNKSKIPSKMHTMTRFDERVAHYFCKGCHRENGRGPVECHECHKEHK